MQVAVDVAGQRRRARRRRRLDGPLDGFGDRAEVGPPDGGRQGECDHDRHGDVQRERRRDGRDTRGNDRFAEGDDDDQPIALGEVRDGDDPAASAAQQRAAEVKQHGQRDQHDLRGTADDCPGDQQHGTDTDAHREAQGRRL